MGSFRNIPFIQLSYLVREICLFLDIGYRRWSWHVLPRRYEIYTPAGSAVYPNKFCSSICINSGVSCIVISNFIYTTALKRSISCQLSLHNKLLPKLVAWKNNQLFSSVWAGPNWEILLASAGFTKSSGLSCRVGWGLANLNDVTGMAPLCSTSLSSSRKPRHVAAGRGSGRLYTCARLLEPGLEPNTHHSFWPTQPKRPPDSEGWEGNITFWWRSWKTDHKGWGLQRAGDCDYFCNLLQLLSPFYVKQKKRQNWLSEKLSNFLWPVNNKAAKFQFQTTAPQRMWSIIFRKLQRFMLFETIIPFLCNLTESTYWMMKKRKVYES